MTLPVSSCRPVTSITCSTQWWMTMMMMMMMRRRRRRRTTTTTRTMKSNRNTCYCHNLRVSPFHILVHVSLQLCFYCTAGHGRSVQWERGIHKIRLAMTLRSIWSSRCLVSASCVGIGWDKTSLSRLFLLVALNLFGTNPLVRGLALSTVRLQVIYFGYRAFIAGTPLGVGDTIKGFGVTFHRVMALCPRKNDGVCFYNSSDVYSMWRNSDAKKTDYNMLYIKEWC